MRRLEGFNIFPVFAWGIVIGLATLTITMAHKLQNESNALESHTTATEAYLKETR